MFPVTIVTGALAAYANKKNPEKDYFYEQGVVAAGAYGLKLLMALGAAESYKRPAATFLLPALAVGMKLYAGRIMGRVAYDCFNAKS
jgi:hypothetical protein